MMAGTILFALLSLHAGDEGADAYLYQPRYLIDHELVGPATPYHPQAGDIMLATDTSIFWIVMHNVALTSHPTHSGIIFKRRDGTMAVLEGGPHDTVRCRSLDALPHLKSYEAEGRVWIRKRAVPLTDEQSENLTQWAEGQDGKIFALQRLAFQLTPFRPRGPFTAYYGKPCGHKRNTFFCSELVMESCCAAGLVCRETARPSATYPRDLFFDSSINPYINKHLKLAPEWDPPARFTSHGCADDLPACKGKGAHGQAPGHGKPQDPGKGQAPAKSSLKGK